MDRVKQLFSKMRAPVSGWIVTGIIIAATGFTPQEWAAWLFRLFPAMETKWLSGVDLRLVLVALGTAIVVCSVMLQQRASRRLATAGGRGSVTTTQNQSAALAQAETPVRVDRAELGGELRSPLLDNPSIAVLPFQNMSGDPQQDYFSDGITEDIITDLSKVSGLLVIARTSTFVYKGKAFSVSDVCRELGVKFAVEGSVRKAGNRIRVTAQLIDGTHGAHLWAERYDRDLTDIFEVQDEVTRRIVDALKVQLTPGEEAHLVDTPTRSFEAHDLFLRARELLRGTKLNREIFDQAVALLTRAIALDPDYAEPYAGLAMAHNLDFQNHWTGAPDAIDVAAHFATLAIEKGPSVPYAHFIAAVVAIWKRNLERAKQETERALALSPNFAPVYGTRGLVEIYSGDPLAAIPFIERAMRLDPAFAHQYMHFLGSAYLVAGQYETAAASFRERIRLMPDTDLSRALLASALGHLGDIGEARRIWAELKQVNPRYSFAEHLSRLPFSNPADADRIKDGLAKAGLPT
jgi:adenylate cyclase